MAIYVDELMDHTGSDAWAVKRLGPLWCHMMADTVEELHAMADRIGLKRAWFQGPPKHRMPHYDLVPPRRIQAVAAGAIELDYDRDEDVLIHRNLSRKHRGLPPCPATSSS